MPELFDDRRELDEGLMHKLDIYGLPLVLERLGAVVAASDPRRGGVSDAIAAELKAMSASAALDQRDADHRLPDGFLVG